MHERLETLAIATAHDLRITYDPALGLLSLQQPPLAEIRVAAAEGPLFAASLLAGAGATGLHFDGRPGRMVFASTDADLVPAARALRLAQSLTGRAVLDVRVLALPPGSETLWNSLTRAAPRVHYAPEGAAALSWPYEDLPASSLARDRLLAAATDHTSRRLPLLQSFLTVLPFDPRRPCVSRSSAPLLPSLAPDLGLEWLPRPCPSPPRRPPAPGRLRRRALGARPAALRPAGGGRGLPLPLGPHRPVGAGTARAGASGALRLVRPLRAALAAGLLAGCSAVPEVHEAQRSIDEQGAALLRSTTDRFISSGGAFRVIPDRVWLGNTVGRSRPGDPLPPKNLRPRLELRPVRRQRPARRAVEAHPPRRGRGAARPAHRGASPDTVPRAARLR